MANAEEAAATKHAGGRTPKNLGPVLITLKRPDAMCLLEIATRLALAREHAAGMLIHLALKDGPALVSTTLREAIAAAEAKAPQNQADEGD